MDLVIVIACGIACIAMLAPSFIASYKTANNDAAIDKRNPQSDGEVPLDDICKKYLKLTNLY